MDLNTPRLHVREIYTAPNEPIYVTCLSDLHLDENLCDYEGLRDLVSARNEMYPGKHRLIMIGDVYNLVLPPDLRRYRPSVQVPNVRGKDSWLDATIEYVTERILGLNAPVDLIGIGNHEESVIQYHGTDVTSRLCAATGAFRGGYSGALDYRLNRYAKDSPHKGHATFRIIYHHGAWGGRLAKGYNGASAFACQHDNWNVFLYGHNHASRIDKDVRVEPDPATGRLIAYPVYLVNCASWVESYSDDASVTHYAERKGFLRQPRTAPLIRMWYRAPKGMVSKFYTVEV